MTVFDQIVFVTGLSGAGKSQTMKTFEDLGFYCVDNLPPALVEPTLALLEQAQAQRVALALDVRTGGALGDALPVLERYAGAANAQTLFLDSRDDVLVRRYSETRRRHPFATQGSLREAIAIERTTLAKLRGHATQVVETTSLTHAELKERITAIFSSVHRGHRLAVTIVAFGFKYGIPLDLDMLFDVRFLRNPNYIETLRDLTGADPGVAAYIDGDPALAPFIERLLDMIDFLLPHYIGEGKTQLTLGIGCTGGRHRSVYIARRLFAHLKANDALSLHLDMRDATR